MHVGPHAATAVHARGKWHEQRFEELPAYERDGLSHLSVHLLAQQLSAPNHKSQIACDLKSRSPNRENFPQIAVSGSKSHFQIARFVI